MGSVNAGKATSQLLRSFEYGVYGNLAEIVLFVGLSVAAIAFLVLIPTIRRRQLPLFLRYLIFAGILFAVAFVAYSLIELW